MKKQVKIGKVTYVKLSLSAQLKEKDAELWRIFSRFIRLRDKLTCYTCGKQHSKLSECDAGHYKSVGGSGKLAKFDRRNVHCQCTTCNKFKSGNLSVYAENLERDYGYGILQELSALAKKAFKPSLQWYEDLIRYYGMKLAELEAAYKDQQTLGL